MTYLLWIYGAGFLISLGYEFSMSWHIDFGPGWAVLNAALWPVMVAWRAYDIAIYLAGRQF